MMASAIIRERFRQKYSEEPNSGCWLWHACGHKLGYGLFRYRRKTQKAHRVSWMLHCGEIPDGLKVMHRCDVRQCVNPDHLLLGTQKENVADMTRKGRGRTGDLRGVLIANAVLNDDQVREIRAYVAAGNSQISISRRFGVSPMTVSRVINRKTWSHVD